MNAGLRQRILAEWRGLPQPFPERDRAQTAGQALEKVMNSLGLKDRLTEAQILNGWKEIVGEWFATHTCPSKIRDGVLYVQVIQSSVHCELQNCRLEILRKLKMRFGARKIRDVKFRVG